MNLSDLLETNADLLSGASSRNTCKVGRWLATLDDTDVAAFETWQDRYRANRESVNTSALHRTCADAGLDAAEPTVRHHIAGTCCCRKSQ